MQDVQQASVRDHNDTSSSTTASTPVSSSQLLDMSTSGGPSTIGDGMEGDDAINKDTYSSHLREQDKEAGRGSQLLSSLPMDLLQESSLLQLFPPGGGHLREQAAGFMGGTVMTRTGLEPHNLGDVAGPSNGVREGTATYNELTHYGLHGALMRDELHNGGLWPHADSTVDAALHALYDMHDEYDGRASAPAALCIRRSHRRTISADSGMKSTSALLKHRLHSGRDSSAKRLKSLHSLSVVSEEPGVAEGLPSPCSPHMVQRANSLPIMDPVAAADGDHNPDATAVEVTSRVTPEICQQEEATTKPQRDAAQHAQHAQEQHEVLKSDSAQHRINPCVAQTTAPQPKAANSAARIPNGNGDSGKGSAVRKTLAARNVVTEIDALEEGMDETNPIPACPNGLPTRAAAHQRLTSAGTSFPFPSASLNFPTPAPLFSVTLPQTSSLAPNKFLYSSQNQTVYYPSEGTPSSLPHSPLSHTPLDLPTSHNIRVILHVPKGVGPGPPPSTYTTALTYPYTNHLTSCITPPTPLSPPPAAPQSGHTSLSSHQHTAASFQLPPTTTFPQRTPCHLTPPPLPAHHTQSSLRYSQAPQAATTQQTFLNPTTHASPSPRHGTNHDMVQRTAFQVQAAVGITPTSTAAPSTAFTPPSRPYTASGMVGADGSTSHVLSTMDAVVSTHSRFDLPLHTLSSQHFGHPVTSLPTHLSNHAKSYGIPYTPSLPPPLSHSLQSAPSIGRVTSLDINSLQSNATRLLPSNSSYPLSLTANPSIPSPMSIIAMDDMNHDAVPGVLLSASSPLPSPMSGLSLPNVSSEAVRHQQHPPSIMPLSTLSLSRPPPAHPSTLPLTDSFLLGSRSSMHDLGGATEHFDTPGFPYYGARVSNSTTPGSVPAAGGYATGIPATQMASPHVSPFAAPSIQSQGGTQPSSMPKPWSIPSGAVTAATTSVMPKPWNIPPGAVNATTSSSMPTPWGMPSGAVNVATTSSDGVASLHASRPFSGLATDSASGMRQHSAHWQQSPADQGHAQSMTHPSDCSWRLHVSMASLTSSPYAAQILPTSLMPSANAVLTWGVHSRQPAQGFSTAQGLSTRGEAQGLSTLGEAQGLTSLGEAQGLSTLGEAQGLTFLGKAQGLTFLGEAQTGTQVHESQAYSTITELAPPTTYFPQSNHLAAANKYASTHVLTAGALSHSPSLAARMTAAAETAGTGPLEGVHAPPPAAVAALSPSPSFAARMTAAGQPSSAHAPPPAAPKGAFPHSSHPAAGHPAAGGQHMSQPSSRFNEQSHAAWIGPSSPSTVPSSAAATVLAAGAMFKYANTVCFPAADPLACPHSLPLAKPSQAPRKANNFFIPITPSPPVLPSTSLPHSPTDPLPCAMWSTQLLQSDESQTMSLDDTCILSVPSSSTPQAPDLAGKSPPHGLLLGSNMPLASSQLGGQHTLLGRQMGLHPCQSHANPPDPPHVIPHGSNGQPRHGPSSTALHSQQLQWHRPTHVVPSQSHGATHAVSSQSHRPTHVVSSQSHGATHAVPTHDSSACAAAGTSAQATSSLGDFVSDIVLLHEVCAVLGAEDQALVWQQPVEVGRQLVQDLRGKVPAAQWKAYVVEAVKLLRAQANMAKLTNNTGVSE